jgi:hypothetical protein
LAKEMREYLHHFEDALRKRFPDLLAELQPGVSAASGDLGQWYRWRNGQSDTSERRLFGLYRFVPEQEARATLKGLRSECFRSPGSLLALCVFAPRSLVSIPLLIDGTGDGYYFNLITRNVFYRFEGERSTVFRSFAHLVDYLVEILESECRSDDEFLTKESELIEEYRK